MAPVIQPFVWGRAGRRMTPEEIAREREIADKLGAQAGDTSPVGHWLQGAARVADAVGSIAAENRASTAEKQNIEQDKAALTSLLGGGSSIPPSTANVASALGQGGQPEMNYAQNSSSGMNSYRDAIASIESAGSGDYSAIGPTHPKLGRPLGRYQIMESNIPAWSQEVLGRAVTPDEFMANPQLQDAIFDGKFGQYVQKFGLEGAVQAWLGGPGGVGKTDRTDSLGTSIGEYGQKFNAALGGGQSGYSAPSTPAGATPAAPQAAAIDPSIIETLSSPYTSPQTKQIASMLLQDAMSQRQKAEQAAMAEQQRAQEIQRRQQIAQAAGINPAYAMDDAMWAEAAKSPFAAPSTSTVGNVVIDNRTGKPLYTGNPEPTTGMLDYKAYADFEQSQGRTPLGPLEYEQALRRSGATSVNNILGGGKFGDKSDELAARRLDTIVSEGRQASSLLGDLQNLAEIGTQIQTGKGAEAMLALGPYAQALGIDVSKELEPLQAYKSIVDRLAPQLRVPGSGTTSDFDAKQFLSSLPNAGRLPGGNEVINLTMQSVQQVKLEAANIARQALRGDMTWQEAEDKIAGLPNPYAQFKAWQRENKTAAPSGVRQGGAAASAGNPIQPQANKAKTGVTWEILD